MSGENKATGMDKGAATVAPKPKAEPNLPDLTIEPYKTLVAIWKHQGQPLCETCGYQKNEAGVCVWDASHE